jgi:hypothetical protein
MHFDDAQFAAIQQYLDDRWPSPRTCPVCRRNPDHWRISETPVLLPLLTGSPELDVRDVEQAAGNLSAAPCVAATCSACGHVLLFSSTPITVGPVESLSGPRFSLPSI